MSAKWIWENDPNHYLVNQENSNKWYEVKNGLIENEYKHVRYEKSNPVIYDENHNIYIKVFDKVIISLDDTEDIDSEEEIANGHWEIKPSVGSKRVKKSIHILAIRRYYSNNASLNR